MQNDDSQTTRDTTPTQPTARARAVSIENLGELIRAKRLAEKLTLEQVAQQSGVSAATLSRWERLAERLRMNPSTRAEERYPAPDTRTFTALASWLGVSLERMMEVSPPPLSEGNTLPDVVDAHLRADRNLDSETAKALARMFRLAYEQFSRLSVTSAPPMAEQQTSSDPNSTPPSSGIKEIKQ